MVITDEDDQLPTFNYNVFHINVSEDIGKQFLLIASLLTKKHQIVGVPIGPTVMRLQHTLQTAVIDALVHFPGLVCWFSDSNGKNSDFQL